MKQKLFIFLLIFGIVSVLNAQETLPKNISYEDYSAQHQLLLDSFACCKLLPDSFEIQTLIALSKYPELKNTQIDFKEKRIATTMVTRPKLSFIFKNRTNRQYIIYINNSTKTIKGVLLDTVPFNGQVGVISHELAHVVDFSQKSNFQILGNGIGYLFPGWRRNLEYKIDKMAINHGFVWQIHTFADFIVNKSNASEKYKNYKRRNYMSPEDIIKYYENNK